MLYSRFIANPFKLLLLVSALVSSALEVVSFDIKVLIWYFFFSTIFCDLHIHRVPLYFPICNLLHQITHSEILPFESSLGGIENCCS